MQKNHFFIIEQFKNTESAQLSRVVLFQFMNPVTPGRLTAWNYVPPKKQAEKIKIGITETWHVLS